ncbi:glycosyltransferase family 39 protein [Candidatus Nomurabacteria bacterium]|nr:glycosyltransferase family 39 protein [Candidatus Nomurabacteria bacterium]
MPKIKIAIGFVILSILISFLLTEILPQFPVISDFLDYDNIAVALSNGQGYITISEQQIIYPPLYPIFLSVIYYIFGHVYSMVFLFQFILSGTIASICSFIAYDFFKLKKVTSLLIGIIVLFWPYMILYSLLISSEMVFIFFLITSVFFFFKFIEDPSLINAIITGATIGLAILARPVALLLPLWMLIGLFILKRFQNFVWTKKHFQNGILSIVVAIVVLLPWTFYVQQKFDRIVPIASNLSHVFNKANNTIEYLDKSSVGEQRLGDLAKAKLKNVYLFWNPGAGGYQANEVTNSHSWINLLIWAYKIFFIIMVILMLSSIYWFRKNIFILSSLSIILYFWCLHIVLFPFPRYTLPIIPLVLILSTFSIEKIISIYVSKNTNIHTS